MNANYTWVFNPGNLTLSGTFIWKDISYAEVFRQWYYTAPSWNQVDLRAVWSGDHDKYEIIFFVNNLFNTLGYDAATPGYTLVSNITNQSAAVHGNATVAPSYDLTPPRLIGGEIHFKF